MSVNLYNKETKTLTQVAGAGGGVAKFSAPIENWLQGHDSSTNAITADRDGICIIELGGTGAFYIDVYDNGVRLPSSWQQQATAKTTFPVIKGHTYYYSGTRSGGVGSYSKSVFYPFVENIVQPIEGGEEYSTTETVIGTWIDGKPLYRKVVVSNTPGDAVFATNVDTLVNVHGQFTMPGQRVYIPFGSSSFYFTVVVNNNSSEARLYTNHSSYTGYKIVLEYTKTTD